MTILLDLDGVLVTTSAWRAVELLADGFMKFNERAARNLAGILDETHADIILTTTHRISYSVEKWQELLENRGIKPASVAKVNGVTTIEGIKDRATEIEEWIRDYGDKKNYVILDDDLSINRLPSVVKSRLVQTRPMIGLDETATRKALNILRNGYE